LQDLVYLAKTNKKSIAKMSFSQNPNKYDTGTVEVMVEGIELILLHILIK